ncbi:MAG TPA: hypothetical protein VF002_04415 [Gaiellaceae bacterium]
MLAPSARPDQLPPLVSLGPITVANGSAVVSGTVGGPTAGSTDVTVNGQSLAVDAAGHFAGTVSLDGASALSLSLKDPTGTTTSLQVPVPAGGGVIDPGVVTAVEQALSSVLQPAGGFKVLNGLPLTVGGKVADGSDLSSLQLNGVDVLHLLNPDGTFTVQLPGTTKLITLSTTDKQGTSATSSYTVQQLVSTRAGTSVSAATAVGLRISGVRYYTKGAAKTHRLRMVVTLKDGLGRLVRGASVQIRTTKPGRTIRRQQVKLSNKVGTATFSIGLRQRALGQRLVIVTTATTPSAKATKQTSVRVPTARSRRASRRHARRHH